MVVPRAAQKALLWKMTVDAVEMVVAMVGLCILVFCLILYSKN
jgi:hypothetical protein